MNDKDKKTITDALEQLHGKTGDAYRLAVRAHWQADAAERDAEQEIQDRFRPHWAAIMAIIKRECRMRRLTFTASHCGYDKVSHVQISKHHPHAVGINHIDYTVSPYIQIQFWVGHGMKIEWCGHARTAKEFERKFVVLLSTLDGYIGGCIKVGGKDCDDCAMPSTYPQHEKTQRCKTCQEGSLRI